jgi:hypothetical protein
MILDPGSRIVLETNVPTESATGDRSRVGSASTTRSEAQGVHIVHTPFCLAAATPAHQNRKRHATLTIFRFVLGPFLRVAAGRLGCSVQTRAVEFVECAGASAVGRCAGPGLPAVAGLAVVDPSYLSTRTLGYRHDYLSADATLVVLDSSGTSPDGRFNGCGRTAQLAVGEGAGRRRRGFPASDVVGERTSYRNLNQRRNLPVFRHRLNMRGMELPVVDQPADWRR